MRLKPGQLQRQTALVRRARLAAKTRIENNAKRKAHPPTLNQVLDDLVRRIVLLRDGFHCQRCNSGLRGKANRAARLQACHLLPKGAYPALRHEVKNVVTLCWRCHFEFWHKNPIEAWEWVRSKYGDDYIAHLRLLAQTRTKVDKQALLLFLQRLADEAEMTKAPPA